MSAKVRVKAGNTVISWGQCPKRGRIANGNESAYRFAVLEGGKTTELRATQASLPFSLASQIA
ncbi:MAG: hypothetical protein JOZ55_02570 [Alphaproteobacteria bacterium]|nr:hypothetical protein [Alphaproteobacteria bacterium]